ncbi:MAG: hypothetical protein AAGA83_21165 [Cyanobacteria bacterium P01_F01_bin.116]
MKHRVRQKNCKLCEQTSAVLYRIKYQPATDWVFVCQTCWTTLSNDNAHYVYGGTWKAKKRH